MNDLSNHPAIRTTCPYCGVGCGVLARPDGQGGAAIDGDPRHPANSGRLCSKGAALGETLSLDGRLLHPKMRGRGGDYSCVSWDEALDAVADGFARTLKAHGPDSIAFYLSGQLLTEDYYIANKLMKGFLGSANVDTNSRLCMASSVAGHKRAFGADTVPGCYEDLDTADLLILVGSNAAWCHPVLFQRMMQNRAKRGARIVVIDPRRTATAEDCDLFLPIAPGMDTVLFSGLLVHLADTGAINRAFVERHTEGFDAALGRARQIAPNLKAAAAKTGLPGADIAKLYAWFSATWRTVTLYSQGVNQSAQGTDKVNAIINCHLAMGRIGRPGMGPFSLTGQPNAMGGREVGGLANQLAAHMGFAPEDIDRVRRFWGAPHMAQAEGLKAVQMFEAIEAGRIKALWVMATNPAVSLPRADHMRRALRKLDLFVVSENMRSNDTVNAGAHVLLPAAAWGEKDGTVTNSERRISRQRAFLPLPGEARPDWWIIGEVAKRLGFGSAFSYDNAAAIFREHAALSAFENEGKRDFDIGGLAGLSDAGFEALEPVQWPVTPARRQAGRRFFAHGRFYTPSQRARFIAAEPPALKAPATPARPLMLNTGRVRDQWHTMTRTGKSPRLGRHIAGPFLSMHPEDAAAHGLTAGGFARITTAHGVAILPVRLDQGDCRGTIFVPIHWSGITASHALTGALVQASTDPFSGQPEMKATPAAVSPVAYGARGFLLSRHVRPLPDDIWWARTAVGGGALISFAADIPEGGLPAFSRLLVNAAWNFVGDIAEFHDERRGLYRAALFTDERVEACLFMSAGGGLPARAWLETQLEAGELALAARRFLLSGKASEGCADNGPTVCACFGVGLEAIRAVIAPREICSVEAIGRALKAGTNCGSCVPELKRILAAELAASA